MGPGVFSLGPQDVPIEVLLVPVLHSQYPRGGRWPHAPSAHRNYRVLPVGQYQVRGVAGPAGSLFLPLAQVLSPLPLLQGGDGFSPLV